jgi:plastocyanin
MFRPSRRHAAAVALGAAAAAVAVTTSGLAASAPAGTSARSAAATRSVNVRDFSFGPSSISVARGTTVVFRFSSPSKDGHNVARRSGPTFKKTATKVTGTARRVFSAKGTYRLYCTIHPSMTLKVVVR